MFWMEREPIAHKFTSPFYIKYMLHFSNYSRQRKHEIFTAIHGQSIIIFPVSECLRTEECTYLAYDLLIISGIIGSPFVRNSYDKNANICLHSLLLTLEFAATTTKHRPELIVSLISVWIVSFRFFASCCYYAQANVFCVAILFAWIWFSHSQCHIWCVRDEKMLMHDGKIFRKNFELIVLNAATFFFHFCV